MTLDSFTGSQSYAVEPFSHRRNAEASFLPLIF
jgi:hypothetical protein